MPLETIDLERLQPLADGEVTGGIKARDAIWYGFLWTSADDPQYWDKLYDKLDRGYTLSPQDVQKLRAQMAKAIILGAENRSWVERDGI